MSQEVSSFVEPSTCETPGTCVASGFGKCQRAAVIMQEIKQYQQGDRTSSLMLVIREAKCTHPQVTEAIGRTKQLFPELF